MAKYYKQNGIHIVEIPVEEFSIAMVNKRKKSCGKDTANAGFFAVYNEGSAGFTLPVGHLVCDFETTDRWTRHYCEERGKFNGDKFTFDSSKWSFDNKFHGKKLSTLIVATGSATILDTATLPGGLQYAISGVPIMRDGDDVKFATYVKGQGWDASPLYGTWHTFVGLKKDGKVIYLMGMKTTSGNMILTAEAYKKMKALGMHDVIKLDGGGSFYINAGGTITQTAENRVINTIIRFKTGNDDKGNPYKEPTSALRIWNTNKEGNRWLQWELNNSGYTCAVDGSFGNDTNKQLKAFQKDRGLAVDGSCGPATRAELKKK